MLGTTGKREINSFGSREKGKRAFGGRGGGSKLNIKEFGQNNCAPGSVLIPKVRRSCVKQKKIRRHHLKETEEHPTALGE